jgi:hypothetical protein
MAGSLQKKYRGWIQGVVLILILVFAVWRIAAVVGNPNTSCDFKQRVPLQDLVYVAHARCRMNCRDISQSLVEKVYLEGELNCKKSSNSKGKSRYALEKRDDRGDIIRIIVEDDDGQHVIITVIRLDKPDKCTCS